MVMTRPPTYHPENFMMKNVKSPNSGLKKYNFELSCIQQN